MSPSEFATSLDSRLAAALSTVRGRLRAISATTRSHLATTLGGRPPTSKFGPTRPDSEPADTTSTPRTSGSDSNRTPNPDSDAAPSDDDDPSFPVLAEEPERDITDLLLERGLTREEYVLEILDEHDGRLRQQRIKEYTGWSAASVSRLLSRMEDAGTIRRFRIGNEKVVCVPDADPRLDVFETEIPLSP